MPLFAIALALMSVGFYLALEQGSEVDLGEGTRADLADTRPLVIDDKAVSTDIAPVELRHAPFDSRTVGMTLRQNSQREGATGDSGVLDTVVELGLEEDVAKADAQQFDREDVLAVTRNYQRAQAEVTGAGGEVIGGGITSQVEDLLRGSVTRMFIAQNGEPLDFEWREVPNPQARRMLYLVRDAHTFLTPRYFTGAVNPGDTWSYKRPIVVPRADVTVEGEVTIDNRFVGVIEDGERRLGVVRQTLEASAEGKLDTEDAQSSFTLTGEGIGLVLVSIDEGKTYAADVSFERKLTVTTDDEPEVYTSEVFLGLRPKNGLSLPEFRQEQDEDGHELEASKDHAETE